MAKSPSTNEAPTIGVSRTSELTSLQPGEYLSDATFFPAPVDSEALKQERKRLNQLWSASIGRARAVRKTLKFSTETYVAANGDADVCVTIIVQRIA